jgi:hypothetical protein
MKFSEQWLRGWVSPQVSRDELVARLSMAGLEVDSVTPAAGEFSGVIVGEVLSTEQHPDADKLACLPGQQWRRDLSGRVRCAKRAPGPEDSVRHDRCRTAGRLQDQESQAARRRVQRHAVLASRVAGR